MLLCLNSYLRSLPRVPTLLRDSLGTPETIFLYQMPLYLLFVPQEVLSCTGRVYAPRWYTRDQIPVPNASRVAVRTPRCALGTGRVYAPVGTSEASFLYQSLIRSRPYSKRPSAVPIVVLRTSGARLPFVRQSLLSCTKDAL